MSTKIYEEQTKYNKIFLELAIKKYNGQMNCLKTNEYRLLKVNILKLVHLQLKFVNLKLQTETQLIIVRMKICQKFIHKLIDYFRKNYIIQH